jgi:hypothetical protein
MLRVVVGFAVVGLLCLFLAPGGGPAAASQATKPPGIDDPLALRKPVHFPNRKEAMAIKLKQSQALLEGIALNDFERIRTATDDLLAVADYVEFLNAYKSDEYKYQVRTMRRAVETIAAKAKAKSLDGVTLGFQNMTNSCLTCHQAMRDKQF